MTAAKTADVTGLLNAWRGGDKTAFDRLTPLIYDDLRRRARRYMRNQAAGNTLQATALVNEAYLRLVDVRNVDWAGRAHFFAVAAQVMRWILVDRARARASARRGGEVKIGTHSSPVDFDQLPEFDARRIAELVAV